MPHHLVAAAASDHDVVSVIRIKRQLSVTASGPRPGRTVGRRVRAARAGELSFQSSLRPAGGIGSAVV